MAIGEMSEGLAGFAKHAGEGEARWWLGSLSVILATSAETGGQFALIDVTDPECAAPLHIHHREDETFIVLEGEIEFNIGGRKIEAGPGSTIFGPRGVPHSYVVRKGPARTLFLFTPGGFEEAVMATSEPGRERRLPASDEGWPDMDTLPSVFQRYGCEFLEPIEPAGS